MKEYSDQQKPFPYTNKGLFRQKANAYMLYDNRYLIKIDGKYESEDVFIRLVKVYSKFMEKVLDYPFYDDDW